MSPRSTRSVSAPCAWRTRALPRAGGSDATCWARTISTTCAIPGAATPNIHPTSTTSPSITNGKAAIIRRKIPSTSGAPSRRRISYSIMKRVRNAPLRCESRTIICRPRARGPITTDGAPSVGHGVWVPAFAGTTAVNRSDGVKSRRDFGQHGFRADTAGPALVRQRDHKLSIEALVAEVLLHLPIELTLDHHADQLGAEAGAADFLRRRAFAFLPDEGQRQAAIGAVNLPADNDDTRTGGEAAVLGRVADQLMHRHAQ